jgi:hypothetical protein
MPPVIVDTTRNTPHVDDPTLWGLLFFLNLEGSDLEGIGPETEIGYIEEHILVLAVGALESVLGVDTPDEYILSNTNKTVTQLAEMISKLPRLGREAYAKKLAMIQEAFGSKRKW